MQLFLFRRVCHNIGKTFVFYEGKVIGCCEISIGMTRAKDKSSNNKNIDFAFVRCSMKGENSRKDIFGYSESLIIKSEKEINGKPVLSRGFLYFFRIVPILFVILCSLDDRKGAIEDFQQEHAHHLVGKGQL